MKAKNNLGAEKALLLAALDQAYNKRSWHGPNLRSSIKGLTAEEAGWRPDPRRKSIAEIVVHCAYWKYAVRRRLRGEKRGSFALPGSNWFALPEPFSVETWNNCLTLLDGEHAALRAAAAEVADAALHRGAATATPAFLIQGAAAHDLYHAGQVNLLKRMLDDAAPQPGRSPGRGSKPKHDGEPARRQHAPADHVAVPRQRRK
jgi:hypothetical protein